MKSLEHRKRTASSSPAPAPEEGELPHALTFYLTHSQREAVLARLKEFDRARARALCRALGVQVENTARGTRGKGGAG